MKKINEMDQRIELAEGAAKIILETRRLLGELYGNSQFTNRYGIRTFVMDLMVLAALDSINDMAVDNDEETVDPHDFFTWMLVNQMQLHPDYLDELWDSVLDRVQELIEARFGEERFGPKTTEES